MSVSYKTLNTKIRNKLATALTIADDEGFAHDATQMKEAIPPGDLPLLQVYPQSGNTDSGQGNNDRTGFGAAVRQTQVVYIADYYARQRSHLGEDMEALLDGLDAITDVLNAVTNVAEAFEQDGLQGFFWSWERVTFVYGDNEQAPRYVGIRFTLTFTIF